MPTAQTSVLGSEDWELTEEPGPKPGCLIVQLRRQALVLPWFRFVYADGDNSRIEIAFASHVVNVSGHGLAVLLAAISTQRVVRLIQPMETDAKFRSAGTPGIDAITVALIK